MITIDKNIPLEGPAGSTLKYPWDKLQVSDSMLIPDVTTRLISPSATAYAKRYGMKFVCRSVEGGTRVWRTA